jgi:UDP-3-O-[3-hydroxymyristoyl] glucosamine N-acyltransferase
MEVENPSAAFSRVIGKFARAADEFVPGVSEQALVAEEVEFDPAQVSIHAGAVVEKGVRIGAGSEIRAGAVISRGVRIGKGCLVHANAVVREHCELGDRVILQPGAVIGSDGYGYDLLEGRHKKIPQVGIVVLEDDVEIGANTTIDRARFGKTVIGEGTKIDNLVQVAHNVVTGKHCLLVSQSGIAGSTRLGNYVTIAAQAGVAGHLEVVDQVILTARAGATKSVTQAGAYTGMPARPMREALKGQAAQARVPELIRELRALKKRVAELEGR